ncbi:MAG: Holliday junction branch migration protein RuvA [Pirellulaceae bacterium]
MITKIHGKLLRLADELCVLEVAPFEYQVLITDYTRRQLQMQVGQPVSLHTLHYMDGNVAQGGKLTPRLVGFASEIEREFFEMFCSVDGVGVKKALRAMVRPVPDVARAIEQQDVKSLTTMPGIGAATSERIVAKLRRKMAKFALMLPQDGSPESDIERDIVDEVFQILSTLGYSEPEGRQMVERVLQGKKKYKDVDALLQAVWEKQAG